MTYSECEEGEIVDDMHPSETQETQTNTLQSSITSVSSFLSQLSHAHNSITSQKRTANHSRKRPHFAMEQLSSAASIPHRPIENTYSEDLILQCPRQVISSRVFLNFAKWMEWTSLSRLRNRRLELSDVQNLLLNTIQGIDTIPLSPYLSNPIEPLIPRPKALFLILLDNFHPAVLQKCRSSLSFFNDSTSVPCSLSRYTFRSKADIALAELLYKYPKSSVDLSKTPGRELFKNHELTFLIRHSAGWNDELILQTSGQFFQSNQPRGGNWKLDGDLLHLQWRVMEKDGAISDPNSFLLDVLVAEDSDLTHFSTDPTTDKVYAQQVPAHLQTKRRRHTTAEIPETIRISLIKAVKADSECTEEAIDLKTLCQELPLFEYYVLTREEMELHAFPIDVESEQKALNATIKSSVREHFVQTSLHSSSTKQSIVAIDCEMCETDLGMELTRVTVVNMQGIVMYDELVKPQSTILNYHTEHSGITIEMLQSIKTNLADVQQHLLTLISSDTILVGHSLTSDLRALRIVHHCVSDTAILYPHARGFPYKNSLKLLAKTFLHRDIQTEISKGHDSAEDAITAMELFKLKVKNGPYFGIPEMSYATAHDSLLCKLEKGKRCSFYHVHIAKDLEEKPWQSYASGSLRKKLNDPFRKLLAQINDEKSVAHAEECLSLQALAQAIENRQDMPQLTWMEIQAPAGPKSADMFLKRHEEWIQLQESMYLDVNAFLERIALSQKKTDTLFAIIPQGDLTLFRYLKALRTQLRWNDRQIAFADPWTEDMQNALYDAQNGVLDSCMFLHQT